MPLLRPFVVSLAAILVIGCSPAGGDRTGNAVEGQVSLRHLTETNVAAPERDHYTIQGEHIPTPSHPDARYFLLRQRQPALAGTIIGIIREERNRKIAYARVEVDCGRRLFHVLGVGNRRSFAELAVANDGPLRSIQGLPLRQELAGFMCSKNRTPLAAA